MLKKVVEIFLTDIEKCKEIAFPYLNLTENKRRTELWMNF